MKRIFAITILLSLIMCSSIIFRPSEVSANPISIIVEEYNSGGLFLGENVSMPNAEVNISLDPFDTKTFTLESIFELTSVTNQTIITAFAYPWEWDTYRVQDDMVNCNFIICQNQILVDYITLTFEEVISKYNETSGTVTEADIADWWEIADHHFAAFNLSFIETSSLELTVSASSSFSVSGGSNDLHVYSGFRYCVGSAYSWSGVTQEIIIMNVKGMENTTTRIGDEIYVSSFSEFYPGTDLAVTKNEIWSTAIWNLTLGDIDIGEFHVGFGYESYSYSDPLIYHYAPMILVIVTTAVVVILGTVIVKRRRTF